MQRLPVLERRAALVRAALAVGEREGAAAITVRRVADEAGVSSGVVHYCFSDKTELLVEVATAIVAELSAAGLTAVEMNTRSTDLQSLLSKGVLALWRLIEDTAQRQLLTYEVTTLAVRDPELNDVAKRQYEVTESAVLGFLDHVSTAAGTTWNRPRTVLAGFVTAVIDGVTLRWLVDHDSAAARRSLRVLADQIALAAS